MSIDVVVPTGQEVLYERFHFSQGVRHGGLLLCAGQLGSGSDGKVPADPAEDFRNAWRAVGRLLETAGLGYRDIVEYTTFHVGLREHLETFMAVRDEFLDAPWPAWTAIGVSELAIPGARVEIRVTAALR